MLVTTHQPIHLTYCMNVHPGDSLANQWDAVRDCAGQVRNSLQRESPSGIVLPVGDSGAWSHADRFGLGLRLGKKAIDEASGGDSVRDFSAWCHDHGYYIFTINGFPYGEFHAGPVKASVYRPDWTSPERRDYTFALADMMSQWLPEGASGSISTMPGWYAPDYTDEAARQKAGRLLARNLGEVAKHLEKLADETGSDVCLGLEPEPWCNLETSEDVVRLFYEQLTPTATQVSETVLRRRIGVCVDTCHCALAFERPADVVTTLVSAGIRIAKIQLSAALSFQRGSDWKGHMQPFAEPVYFHQTAAKAESHIHRWPDLPEALGGLSDLSAWDEARVHFHVPLHWEGNHVVASTRDQMDDDFWLLVRSGVCPHLEIETYTFGVLPEGISDQPLYGSIEQEYRWVLAQLDKYTTTVRS